MTTKIDAITPQSVIAVNNLWSKVRSELQQELGRRPTADEVLTRFTVRFGSEE